MSIAVSNLSYVLQDGTSIFNHISFHIGAKTKCALVGANGCGKSSLVNLLYGNLVPADGDVALGGSPYLVPQHHGQYNHFTVGEVLGIHEKLRVLKSILSGDSSDEAFDILGDDWTIEEDARNALDLWGLENVGCDSSFGSLSGGEKTKVFLAGISLHNPRIIFMDEPTNHLDGHSRDMLYDFIDCYNGTLLVVSHDKALLNRFSTILELSEKGIRRYTMSFGEYRKVIECENKALAEHAESLKKELRKAKSVAREVAEQQQKQDSRGKHHSEQKGLARISMGNLKNQAENSTARLSGVHHDRINSLSKKVAEAASKVIDSGRMAVDFSASGVHAGKVLIEARGINHSYPGNRNLWSEDVDIVVRSGDRVLVTGANGSGKSTLMRIITGSLAPSCGTIYRADNLKCVYLDQEYSLIDNDMTVSQQIQKFNHHALPEHELNIRLDRFLFPKSSWVKRCSALSGGEKMRLSLCCLMVADSAPDIIIADEPTNNLDIFNQEVLTDTLDKYSGTLIVISHDSHFVNQLSLTTRISL